MVAVEESPFQLKNLVLGILVVVIIIAGFSYFKSRKKKEVAPSPTPEEIIVQEEGAVKKSGELVQPISEEEMKKMREEIDGVLANIEEVADLKDVSGGWASGKAKRLFSDGKFYYKLTAVGLKSMEKGYYYEGWLKQNSDYLSTGRVEVDNLGNGVLYYLTSTNRSDYNGVVVTLEPEDGNPAPATAVLEGSF